MDYPSSSYRQRYMLLWIIMNITMGTACVIVIVMMKNIIPHLISVKNV